MSTIPGNKPVMAALIGFAAADSSRIRRADLDRFTINCLISNVNRLRYRIHVAVKVKPLAIFPDAQSLRTEQKRP